MLSVLKTYCRKFETDMGVATEMKAMGRYSGPNWLQDAQDALRATVGVAAVEHDSENDYIIHVSDEVDKSTVMNAVENLYSDSYVIRVSPTREDDRFFVSINESE